MYCNDLIYCDNLSINDSMEKMMKKLISIFSGFLILIATSAISYANVATVNVVQIFGTVDPSKINDYTEYMAGVNMYDALTTLDDRGTILPNLAESWDVSDDTLSKLKMWFIL